MSLLGRAQEYVDTWQSWKAKRLTYKVEMGRKLAEAREAVLAGAERLDQSGEERHRWEPHPLHRAIKVPSLGSMSSPDAALTALQAMWTRRRPRPSAKQGPCDF